MVFLEFLEALWDLYLIFVVGPRAAWRMIRRLTRPTALERTASSTPEMKRFRRNVGVACAGWLVLSLAVAILAGSGWMVLVMPVLGLIVLPGLIEKRYDRLLQRLHAAGSLPRTEAAPGG